MLNRGCKCMTLAFMGALTFAAVFPVRGQTVFASVDYPGVDYSSGGYTQLLGINNEGSAVGIAQIDASSPTISFRYDIKSRRFRPLPDYSSGATAYTLANGINNADTIVGGESENNGVTEFAYVLKRGGFEVLSRPGSQNFTEARAVNVHGLVSGFALNDIDGTYSGFIYDPLSNTWTDVLPSAATIAQGINSLGELVGNVYENAGVVCAACPAGPYGFFRQAGDLAAIFSINGKPTYARGVSDSDVITGFVSVGKNGENAGFVIPAPKHAGFQTLDVPQKDLVRFPGAAGTAPEGISDDGTLAGFWTDRSGANHGFIAASRPP